MTELPIDENTPRILIVEDEPKLGRLLVTSHARRVTPPRSSIMATDTAVYCVKNAAGSDPAGSDAAGPGTDGRYAGDSPFSDIPIVMVTAQNRRDRPAARAGNRRRDYICKPQPARSRGRVKTFCAAVSRGANSAAGCQPLMI